MAHNVETMAYAGETPWHGLGVKVLSDLTTIQMLKAAKLDWTVSKIPAYVNLNGKRVPISSCALVRDSDNQILDVVSTDWKPVQNWEAFAFFDEFVNDGTMEMHTAGSLQGGKIVWVLAKIKDSFTLFKKDRVEAYLLFTCFHKYGFSTDGRFTAVRVVCNNTLNMALGKETAANSAVKVSHRVIFDPEKVKVSLGIARKIMTEYKEKAQFLGAHQAKNEDVVEYFARIFPVASTSKKAKRKQLSRNAIRTLELLGNQPGAEFGEGSWWAAYNAITCLTDHEMGRDADTRLTSSWYGPNRRLKIEALDVALDMAGKSKEMAL